MDRIRDGRSFTTRRVVAIQHGRAIFNMSTSFHVDEPGLSHQFPMPDVPDPEDLDTLATRLEPYREALGDWFARPHPIDQRHIGELPFSHGAGKEPVQRLWIRADGTLPDDPLLHACIAAYASDMSLFDTMLAPHDVQLGGRHFMGASLDHCMWFHRPVPGRRVAALRHGQPHRLRRPGTGPGLPVHQGGRAGRLDGPRRA